MICEHLIPLNFFFRPMSYFWQVNFPLLVRLPSIDSLFMPFGFIHFHDLFASLQYENPKRLEMSNVIGESP
jgi:hypothetical protein